MSFKFFPAFSMPNSVFELLFISFFRFSCTKYAYTIFDPLAPKLTRTPDGYSLLSFPVLIFTLTEVKEYTLTVVCVAGVVLFCVVPVALTGLFRIKLALDICWACVLLN